MPPAKTEYTKSRYSLRDNARRLRKNRPDPESESDNDDDFDDEDEYETVEESSDSSYKPPKSRNNKKRIVDSDSEEESEESEELEDEDMSRSELRKMLSRIFPSKYMSEKVKKDKKMKNIQKELKWLKKVCDEEDSDEDNSEDYESEEDNAKKHSKKSSSKKSSKKSSSKKSSKKNSKTKNKKSRVEESEEESEEEDEYYYGEEDFDEEDEDEDEEIDEDDEDEDGKKGKKLNIIFTIGGKTDEDYSKEYEDYFQDDDEDEAAVNDENDENEECDSDDEKTFMKENYQELLIPEEASKKSDESENEKKSKKSKKDKKNEKKLKEKKSKKQKEEEEKKPELADIESEYIELLDLKKVLSEKLNKKPDSKILRNAVKECKESIMKLIKSARLKNTKSYHKLIHIEKNKTNEMDYFKKKLSNKEQLKIVKDLQEINEHIYVEKPYRLSLLQSKMPAKLKALAMQKLNVLRSMDPSDNEYHKIKNWVDTFMKIPFGINKNLSVSMADGIDVCDSFLKNAKATLDECVFGLDDAKLQIMQMLGQWIANPSAMGSAIAIKGPMGTGKTTLVKEGISKILGREFAFIALGGAGDSSFLEGHSYTYEGSTWGKIVQILIESKCMNPVIYFDELDKISDTPRGQEIIGVLTHLTDTSQNNQFHDKYFSEVDFDLSKCLFIFSYNDENLVNPILRDRMYRIQTKGYDCKEKTVIARNYLLPKICEQVNFNNSEVIIPDDTIQYIVNHEAFTKREDGVRNLKRCLEIVHTKLNLHRLVKPGNNIFGKTMDINVSFPFTVTRKIAEDLIKSDENQKQSFLHSMYV